MLNRDRILALIPHQGTMCLLDEVHRWDETHVFCRSRSHQRADHPMRYQGRIRALHLCEYGAQAMAVHGGLLAARAGGRARPGMLVSLRAVTLHRDWIDDLVEALDVRAEVLLAAEHSWQYAITVHHDGELLAEGRAAVMLSPEDPTT